MESENQPRKRDPRIIEDWITIGSLLLKNGDSEEAMKYFKFANLSLEDIKAILAEQEKEAEKEKEKIK